MKATVADLVSASQNGLSLHINYAMLPVETVVTVVLVKNKPPGIDNLDGKLLKLVAEEIAPPICHIINMSNCLCPLKWKRAKITTEKQEIAIFRTAIQLAFYRY